MYCWHYTPTVQSTLHYNSETQANKISIQQDIPKLQQSTPEICSVCVCVTRIMVVSAYDTRERSCVCMSPCLLALVRLGPRCCFLVVSQTADPWTMCGCWGAGAKARRCAGRSCGYARRHNHALDMQWQVGWPERGRGGVGGQGEGAGAVQTTVYAVGLGPGREAALDAAAAAAVTTTTHCTCNGRWRRQQEGPNTASYNTRGLGLGPGLAWALDAAAHDG
jgi:hypothetical protein